MTPSLATEAGYQVLGALIAHRDEFMPKFLATDGNSHLFADQYQAAIYRGLFKLWCNEIEPTPRELKRAIGDGPPFTDTITVDSEIERIAANYVTGAHWDLYYGRLWAGRKERELRQALDLAQASNGDQTLEEKIADLEAAISRIRNHGAGRDKEQYTLGELVAEYPRLSDPIIDGVLRQGEVGNLVSDPKIGKSWMAMGLATAVATGADWFGFPTTQGKVLYVDNELTKPTLGYRFRQVADGMGVPFNHIERDIEIRTLRGKLRTMEALAVDLYRIKPGQFKLIIFDAKYKFAAGGTSENSNNDETQLYILIDSIAERTGSACVLVHHASKGDQSGKKVTDVGAGAGSQSRAADAHLILRSHEDEGAVVLDAAVRSFPPIEPIVLRWSFPVWTADHEADPARLKVPTTGNDQRQAARDRDGKNAIVTALLSGPATARSLRISTSISRQRLERLLGILESEGQITSREVTVAGNKCMEYSNAEQSV